MSIAMRPFLHMFCLMFSLLALLTPGFAALASDFVPTPPAVERVWAADMSIVEISIFKPCQKQGGKRVVSCHIDTGLLRGTATFYFELGTRRFALPGAEEFGAQTGTIVLPPPRRA